MKHHSWDEFKLLFIYYGIEHPFNLINCQVLCFCLMQWVLSSKEINFPYPVALTLLHMVFSSVVCFAITKVFKVLIHALIMAHTLLAVLLVRCVTMETSCGFICSLGILYRSGHTLTISFYLDDVSQIIKIEEGMTTDM